MHGLPNLKIQHDVTTLSPKVGNRLTLRLLMSYIYIYIYIYDNSSLRVNHERKQCSATTAEQVCTRMIKIILPMSLVYGTDLHEAQSNQTMIIPQPYQ